MRIRIKRSTSFFLAGLITALCFAGPLAGFVSGCFWPSFSGGDTKILAAERILYGEYWRHLQGGDPSLARYDGVWPSDCEMRVGLQAMSMASDWESYANLENAIHRFRSLRRNLVEDMNAANALASLPAPLIGALEGCLGRSLLSHLCTSYIEQRVASAREAKASETHLEFAKIDKEMAPIWCAAARGAPPVSRNSPSAR